MGRRHSSVENKMETMKMKKSERIDRILYVYESTSPKDFLSDVWSGKIRWFAYWAAGGIESSRDKIQKSKFYKRVVRASSAENGTLYMLYPPPKTNSWGSKKEDFISVGVREEFIDFAGIYSILLYGKNTYFFRGPDQVSYSDVKTAFTFDGRIDNDLRLRLELAAIGEEL